MRDHILPKEPVLGELIWNTGQVAGRVFDRYMRGAGGTRPQFYVFSVLQLHPQASQSEIAAAVGVEGATVTHHLEGMESEGLIVRRKDLADRRVTRVEMTETGWERWHTLRQAADRFDEAFLGFLSPDEAARLSDLLRHVFNNGEAILAEPR